MAIITPILGQLSGSIGGQTFSHNKGGPYVRRRAIPINPSTVAQQLVRTTLANRARAWAGIGPANQSAWETWASLHPVINSLGQSITLTGEQAFVMLNSRTVRDGNPQVSTAPVLGQPASILTLVVTASAALQTLSCAFTPTPLDAGNKLEVWMTKPAGSGRNDNVHQAHYVAASAAAAISPFAPGTKYPFLVGQEWNMYVRVVALDGQASVYLRARAIAVA